MNAHLVSQVVGLRAQGLEPNEIAVALEVDEAEVRLALLDVRAPVTVGPGGDLTNEQLATLRRRAFEIAERGEDKDAGPMIRYLLDRNAPVIANPINDPLSALAKLVTAGNQRFLNLHERYTAKISDSVPGGDSPAKTHADRIIEAETVAETSEAPEGTTTEHRTQVEA